MQLIVRWRDVENGGLEHLHLRLDDDQVVAEALVIGGEEGAPYGLRYRVVCDRAWRVREMLVTLAGGDREIRLRSEGDGRWFDRTGRLVPDLDGCIDIDIAATPFTNTLPIRRLDLQEGQSQDIRVVYVPVPALEISAVDQRYTCVDRGQRYRYEGFPRGFAADLTVDADGLAIDYPGLFQRVL